MKKADDTMNDADLDEILTAQDKIDNTSNTKIKDKQSSVEQQTIYESPEQSLEDTCYKTTLNFTVNTAIKINYKEKCDSSQNESISDIKIDQRRASLKRSASESENVENETKVNNSNYETNNSDKRPKKRINLNDENKLGEENGRKVNENAKLNESFEKNYSELEKKNDQLNMQSSFIDDCIVLD